MSNPSIPAPPPAEGSVAAIYARKSNEQNGVADEAKSVHLQIENARAYAERKGWTVDERHIYSDDGISAAEFERRPGFVRLMNALKPRPPFSVLIMRDEDRLGRELIETPWCLKQLITTGVRVFVYLEDRERTLNSPMEKLLCTLSAFGDEMEREKARTRTRDVMQSKARAGYVAAGRKFGYTNTPKSDDQGGRSHVDRVINDAEAAVVRRIFALYAEGCHGGFRKIADVLNAEHVPAPRPARKAALAGWAPSTIRDLLKSPIYRGSLVWGRTVKRDRWGQRVTRRADRRRPADGWIVVEKPELAIVDAATWAAVQARLAERRATYLRGTDGRLHGKPLNGVGAEYLLTGLTNCGQCGGSLTVRRKAYYGCLTFHTKGRSVCANRMALPRRPTEAAVLETVRHALLQPDDVLPILDGALAALSAEDVTGTRERLEAKQATLGRELTNLAEGIAAGKGVTLVEAITTRERKQAMLREELAGLTRLQAVVPLDRGRLAATLRARLTDWQGLLAREPAHARQMLRKLLDGRLVFTPLAGEGSLVEFTGTGTLDPVIAGIITGGGLPTAGVAPTGFEPVFQP